MTRGRFPLQWDFSLFVSQPLSRSAGAVANLLHFEAALVSQGGNANGSPAFVRGMLGSAGGIS